MIQKTNAETNAVKSGLPSLESLNVPTTTIKGTLAALRLPDIPSRKIDRISRETGKIDNTPRNEITARVCKIIGNTLYYGRYTCEDVLRALPATKFREFYTKLKNLKNGNHNFTEAIEDAVRNAAEFVYRKELKEEDKDYEGTRREQDRYRRDFLNTYVDGVYNDNY